MSDFEALVYRKDFDVTRACFARLAFAILTGDQEFLKSVEYYDDDTVFDSTWLPHWVDCNVIFEVAKEFGWNYEADHRMLRCSK